MIDSLSLRSNYKTLKKFTYLNQASLGLISEKTSYLILITQNKTTFSSNKKYNSKKIMFMDPLNYEDYLLHLGRSSVLLDPLFYGAGNSFFESMLYGTPTVTFPTDHIKSRLVLGAYKQM